VRSSRCVETPSVMTPAKIRLHGTPGPQVDPALAREGLEGRKVVPVAVERLGRQLSASPVEQAGELVPARLALIPGGRIQTNLSKAVAVRLGCLATKRLWTSEAIQAARAASSTASKRSITELPTKMATGSCPPRGAGRCPSNAEG
jgi:hypothetical protein